MRPTTRELIAHVVDELREDIVPMASHDAWLASRLRSVVSLLTHVAARLDHELDVLIESDHALAEALAACARAVPGAVPREEAQTTSGVTADLEQLEKRNRHHRSRIETTLRALRADQSPAANDARVLLIEALRSDADREKILYQSFMRMANF